MIEKITEQIGKLTLISHRDGQVVGCTAKETVGQWIKPGKPFCEIGDPRHLEAHLIVDQARHPFDRPRSRRPGSRFTAKPRRHTRAASPRSPSATAKKSPPSSPTGRGRSRLQARPQDRRRPNRITAVYEVIIPIENPDLELEPGLRGSPRSMAARIHSPGG